MVPQRYNLVIKLLFITMELWQMEKCLIPHMKEINLLMYKLELEKLSRDGIKELLECVQEKKGNLSSHLNLDMETG